MRILLLMLVPWFLACSGSEASDPQPPGGAGSGNEVVAAAPQASGAPRVEEEYQDDIDEAWAEAVAGEDPLVSCSLVKGSAAASEPGTATRALEACNVDIPVRYFLTDLDRVESGDQTCSNFMILMHMNLPALTISASDPDAAPYGENDAQRRIKDRLRERVTEVCPDLADRF